MSIRERFGFGIVSSRQNTLQRQFEPQAFGFAISIRASFFLLVPVRNDGEAVACDENRLTVTRFGGPPELGSNEQIFGVKEQILGRDWSD
jgi:hypothetical protein